MSTGKGALGKLGKSCRTGFAPDFGSGCVHRQLCASLSVFVRGPVESRWEPRELIAPGAATLPHISSKQCCQLPASELTAFFFYCRSYHGNYAWHQWSHGAAFQSHHSLQQETHQDGQVGSSPKGTHLSGTARNKILVPLEEAKKSEVYAVSTHFKSAGFFKRQK